MGLFSHLSEGVVSGIVCDYFDKYSGPQCTNLQKAITTNVDIYQLWVDNARKEGIHDLNKARQWTHMFPKVQYMVTPLNVKRWLREQGLTKIIKTVESTDGGEEWLAWQVGRFRKGLWGQ
jgi:hypothetical protein